MLETSNAAPENEEYIALLDAQYGHNTRPSAVQPGMKIQPLNLLRFLHGIANHPIVGSLVQHSLPIALVGRAASLHPTVALTPWPGPISVLTIRVFPVTGCV